MAARRVIDIEESQIDEETGLPVKEARLICPVFNGEMDRSGGFWASFTSVAWVMRGRDPQDPHRRHGDREPKHPFAEWEERLVM
jgi:hypothetical protein